MTDIQAGDVVVCVDNGPDRTGVPASHLGLGKIYRVEQLWVANTPWGDEAVVKLAGVVSQSVSGGYFIWRFEKLDKATDEFTSQIKAIRPIKQREAA